MGQDLLFYNETDPSNKLVVIADKVTFTGLARNSGKTWLSKSLGIGAIVESTSIKYLNNVVSSSGSGFVMSNMWSNVDKEWKQQQVDGDKFIGSYFAAGQIVGRYWNGVGPVQDMTSGISAGVERLIDKSRSGNIYTITIYNGLTTLSGVLDVLIIDAGETPPDFEFHIACSNLNDGGTATLSGHTRSFIFTGLNILQNRTRSKFAQSLGVRQGFKKMGSRQALNIGLKGGFK